MRRSDRWWIVFAACNVVVALALIWTTAVVLRLERSEMRARAESDYQESLRLAMWRMDSWLSLFLAREAARPPQPRIDSDYLLLYFEVDPRGALTSPQLPLGPIDPLPDVSEAERMRWSKC